jgi:Leucine-rich repeat (LRR) protein
VNVASNEINETPRLPSEISLLSSLRKLNLANNLFSGRVPTEIGLLSDLVDLQLGDNQLTGPIPSELGQSSALQILNLQSNALTGPIPSELGQIPSLQDLYLYDNAFTGTIPSELPTHVTLPYKLVKEYKVSSQAFQDTSSPQYEALVWMTDTDSTDLQSALSDDELVERFTLVLLYFATGGESWWNQAGFLNPLLDTCSWNSIVEGTRILLGVGCNDEGSVTTLDLCKFPKPST